MDQIGVNKQVQEPYRPTILDVIENDICVGCGACVVATRGALSMYRGELGYFQADPSEANIDELRIGSRVCPFADESVNEDILSSEYLNSSLPVNTRAGRYLSVSSARVLNEEYLFGSSSGGMTSWITTKLLEERLVDGVIHVGNGTEDLFEYTVSYSIADIRKNRKSIYYSVSMADVVRSVKGDGKRYAFVGVPCFIKAVRLLARQDQEIADQVKYCIGLVCGHLKSPAYAELLGWQTGVAPPEIDTVDFRVKQPGAKVGHYGFGVKPHDSSEMKIRPTRTLVGSKWGHGMMQLNACNFCDDIFAETADIVLGDAWLPKFEDEWRGTNVVISRNRDLERILTKGLGEGELYLEQMHVEQAIQTQAGNFRHRHDGLSQRLQDDVNAGRWVPRKRIAPGSILLEPQRIELIRQRRKISAMSHSLFQGAKQRGSLDFYIRGIEPLMLRYTRLEKGGWGQMVKTFRPSQLPKLIRMIRNRVQR